MTTDEIKELKNMHTKGELAQMYLDKEKEMLDEFEMIIDSSVATESDYLFGEKLKERLQKLKTEGKK